MRIATAKDRFEGWPWLILSREMDAAFPGSLLVVDWAQGHGWRELSGFLDVTVPAEAFPHLNRRP